MAVYTPLSKDELERALAPYGLKLERFSAIPEGIQNTNYLVQAAEGIFVATLHEPYDSASDLPYFLGLTEHLALKGLPCARALKRSDNGEAISKVKGKDFTVVTFLEGTWPRRVTNEHGAQVGRMLAQMHQAGQDFRPKRLDTGPTRWQQLYAQTKGHFDAILPGLEAQVRQALDYLTTHWPATLPHGPVHRDLFPDNVFFEQGQITGVLDFYFSADDLWVYDLAITLVAWCGKEEGSFDATSWQAMLAGYEAVRALLPEEKEALAICVLGAILWTLFTRTLDRLRQKNAAILEQKDPLEYAKKLQFFLQENEGKRLAGPRFGSKGAI